MTLSGLHRAGDGYAVLVGQHHRAEHTALRRDRLIHRHADHLAACVLDSSGNPVAEPITIPVAVHGLRASRRDGRVRAAITALLDAAQLGDCSAIAVENLNFADSRATGRETMGRGGKGKKFRRTRGWRSLTT